MENEKKKSYWFLIPLVIGLVIGSLGLYLLIKGISVKVPEMGQPDWFDLNSSKVTKIFFGVVLIILGYFMIGIVATLIVKTATNKDLISSVNSFSLSKTISSIKSNPAFSGKKVCQYCGEEYDENLTRCPSCGGKNKKE